jgi:hypothetical protein
MDQFVGRGHVRRDQGMQALDRRDRRVGCADRGAVLCRLPTHDAAQNTGPVRARASGAKTLGRAWNGDRKARLDYKKVMRAVLKTIDPVVLNYAANVLEQEGIEAVVFDTHASVMDGSMGFLPRRLMVLDEDFDRAQKLLRQAVPDHL